MSARQCRRELVDARRLRVVRVRRDGMWEEVDSHGNTVYRWDVMWDGPDDLVGRIRVAPFELDGISYDQNRQTHNNGGRDCYQNMFLTLKVDDDGCRPGTDGYCSCSPRKYLPLPYEYGDICEKCWLGGSNIVGVEECTRHG